MSSWQRFQKLALATPELGLLVDLSKTSLAADALTSDPLVTTGFPAAFAAMDALEKGAIANPDEKRMVGHYWLRAPQLAPNSVIAKEIENNIAAIKTFAADVHAGRIKPPRAGQFTRVLSNGIGGSALGPE